LATPDIFRIFTYNIKIIKVMEKEVVELFKGYSEGLITDRECADMLDLVTNEYTTVVDSSGFDFDWDSDMEHEQYELEASQYDYL